MELRWHHWLVALTIAAALHAVVLARVNWTRAETAPVLRQDPMMVAIEAGHEADELAEFAAPPSVIRETAPGDASAAAQPDPVPLDATAPKPLVFQPPRPVPGLAPNAPVAAVSPEYVDTAPRPAESADTVAPESPGPVTTAPPEAVAGFGPEVAPAAAVTLASESVARTAEQVMALPDAIAMDPAPDAGLAESVALPKATLFPEVMSDPGPEAASTAALGPGAATDVRALVPSTVLMSEHAHSVARLDANLPDPWESAHASEVTAAITAEAVDLELTPIVPIIEVRPPESPATGTVESPLESRPQPVPELAAVAPRDTVTARTAMPRLKQRD
ncbi:MAG: hypothetical protein OEQ18_15270, partial [Gammaproteobacteria bacterium]|nr:hypothetical protein [Gammaproteobacteria bacterium]